MSPLKTPDYDEEDFFKDSRMSFGDHIEELRTHLFRALIGFGLCLVVGFFLDGIGTALEGFGIRPFGALPFGLGRPALEIIKHPVESQMQNFYSERVWSAFEKTYPLPPKPPSDAPEEQKQRYTAAVEKRKKERAEFDDRRQRIATDNWDPSDLNTAREVRLKVPVADLRRILDDPNAKHADLVFEFLPMELSLAIQDSLQVLGKRMNLTTLSVQEAFVVYFKVSLLCGIILSSPWVFWQIWAFVAAGLYPHEKKYVHKYLPFSLGLFLTGVFLCQFIVLPGAVKALLAFNAWIGLDPDLRLSEWLGFAILMPLVFGVSFQTPLVMMFMKKIGVMDEKSFREKRRLAVFVLAVFAAMITPTPDAVSMLYLWAPMYMLYEVGIWLCQITPSLIEDSTPDDEELIGV